MIDCEVEVVGTPVVPEFRDASRFVRRLGEQFGAAFGAAASRVRAVSFPAFQCHGQRRQDVDQLLVVTAEPAVVLEVEGSRISLAGVIICLEHKGHRAEDIRIEDQCVFVKYEKEMSNASKQSDEAMQAARRFLERKLRRKDMFLVNAIYLSNVPRESLAGDVPNVLGADFTVGDFFRLLCFSRIARQVGDGVSIAPRSPLQPLIDSLRELRRGGDLSPINARRLKRITDSYLGEQRFVQHLGSKLVAFKGRAGTGKTTFLLRTAHDLARERNRCIVLTFNHALRLDLHTLLSVHDPSREAGVPAVGVESLNYFLVAVLRSLGILPPKGPICKAGGQFDDAYRAALVSALDSKSNAELRTLRNMEPFGYDYIFLDEAQDVMREERELLLRIYGAERLVVSDGYDQVLRGERRDWKQGLPEESVHVYSLRTSLRMTSQLVQFANALAAELGIGEWKVSENDNLAGGRVIVHAGRYEKALHEQLLSGMTKAEHTAGDMLFGMWKPRGSPARNLPDRLREWGNRVWDGTRKEERYRKDPLHPDEIRVCNYMSVRGLECWTFVAVWLDEFFDEQCKRADPDAPADFAADLEREVRAFYLCMMACTRAIDTLVITIKDPTSRLGRAILAVAPIEGRP